MRAGVAPREGWLGVEGLEMAEPKTWTTASLVGTVSCATALWVMLFCAGVTVETEAARFILAPLGRLSATGDDAALARLAKLVIQDDSPSEAMSGVQTEAPQPKPDSAASRNPGATAAVFVADSSESPAASREAPAAAAASKTREQLAAWAGNLDPTKKLPAFLTCLTCYSPINIAILSILAGLIGGCASKLYVEGKQKGSAPDPAAHVSEREVSLKEDPTLSAVRGLVGYILILAGIYAVFDDPFKNPTTSQYTKLAGFASALAFTLGYDGTRFKRVLETFTKSNQDPSTNANPPKEGG